MVKGKFKRHIELLKELTFAPGVTGWEDPVRDLIRDRVKKYGRTEVDNLGNLTLTLGKGDRHALFVAHMDEIGLIVSHIEESGYLRVKKVGGIDDRILVGRTVDIYPGGSGKPVPGVIGLKPPHLMKDRAGEMSRVIGVEDILIDLGTSSDEETEALGITKLSPVIMRKHFSELQNDMVATRALDDRLGCAALIMALEEIDSSKLKHRVTFAWSVQEELGLRGAQALGHRLRPDYAVAIDSCTTGDSPQVEYHLSAVEVGGGPVLRMLDRMAFASPTMMKHAEAVAKKARIPTQVAVTSGATDGAAIQTLNAAMIALAVPVRYVHSPVEVMSLRDFDYLVKLVTLIATKIGTWR
jgi:putative aminopeptidase FrvX